MGRHPGAKDGMRSDRRGRGSAGGLALALLLAAPLMIAAKCSGDSAHPGEGDPSAVGPSESSDSGAQAPGEVTGPSDGGDVPTTTTGGPEAAPETGAETAGGSDAPADETGPASESAGGQPEGDTTPTAVASNGPPPLPKPIFKKVDDKCGEAPGVGDKAKPFTLKTPAGKDLSLARYRKRVVLLNFWGTWCKPCLKELPEFDRLYRRYRKHGLTLIAVATDEDADKVQAFVKQRKLAAKVAIGGQDLADAYGSPKFPFSFVIDQQGSITAAYRGYEPGCLGKLEQDIRTQLEALRR